jgi:CheY-like chemotaxis protein
MSIKLLLADDSITIQKVLGIIFGGEEYSLTVVDNGKSAVEKARELCPDVLLIDALMPGMSGYEVCEAVRAMPALATKPILLLTGSFEPFDEERAIKCGADAFLAKPFESQQIINKVKELAELGASRAANTVAAEPTAPSGTTEQFDGKSETPDESAPPNPPESLHTNASSDIWGAFTPDPDFTTDADGAPDSVDTGLSDPFEPDVLTILNDETDSQIVQPDAVSSQDQNTGTVWIPVEEHTFEFEDEKISDLPETAFSEQSLAAKDAGFEEIAFEDGTPAEESPVSTVSAAALNEDQLKAAISAVSKEVIERIVWEVVPDLAEAMIREAIRKIKEGA